MKEINLLSEKWLSIEHKDSLKEFKCVDKDGDSEVQLFLQEQALELTNRNLVRTRLLFYEDSVLIGFYSLFNNTIKINKGKRRDLEVYLPNAVKEIPAIRLFYIGVHNEFQGKGYGDKLMASLLFNCAAVSQMSGCSLVTVESTANATGFYKKYDFKHIRKEGKHSMMGINTKGIQSLLN